MPPEPMEVSLLVPPGLRRRARLIFALALSTAIAVPLFGAVAAPAAAAVGLPCDI